MSQSESIDLLSAALVEFQRSAPDIKKNAVNPHFKNRYADLSSIIDAVRAPLTDAGLAVVQLPDGDDLITRLVHKSGQWISSRTALKCSKPDAQGYGSALTYARRYAISAMLNLAADDDDGEAASRAPRKPAAPAQALRKMVAADPAPGRAISGPYPEETTRKRLGEMFGNKFVGYVLDWAISPDRKKPTAVTEFTEAHFASLEKNRATIEKYIEDQVFSEENGPNAIDKSELWEGAAEV